MAEKSPDFQYRGHLWDGHSVSGSIVRAATGQSISCRDRQFDDFMCLPYSDYELILRRLSDCK